MRIAVCSDSHDHILNLRRAVRSANQKGAELLLHCGDLILPFMLDVIAEFNGPTHLIDGNNGGDHHLIATRGAVAGGAINHHGTHASLMAGSLRIAIEHYPRWARTLALSGQFDLVCSGHTHHFHAEQLGGCLLLDPGELIGKDNPALLCPVRRCQRQHLEDYGGRTIVD